MMADPATASLIHPTRSNTSYSYWYLFNFDPNFDAEFEPENWKIAVNNENFRQSVVHAFNRMPALATNDRVDPESLKSNTITPAGFASAYNDPTELNKRITVSWPPTLRATTLTKLWHRTTRQKPLRN